MDYNVIWKIKSIIIQNINLHWIQVRFLDINLGFLIIKHEISIYK